MPSELELAYAALHQLCMPLLDGIERLPAPQRDALGVALGLSGGSTPDRFLVGLAVLTLLSDAAETNPLVVLVDDAHWLDRSSARVLAFVARRLQAESVAILFAARDEGAVDELAGLPDLRLGALSNADAGELLDSAGIGPLDERVRDRIIAEADGNPLALLELPRGLSPAELRTSGGSPTLPLPPPREIRYDPEPQPWIVISPIVRAWMRVRGTTFSWHRTSTSSGSSSSASVCGMKP